MERSSCVVVSSRDARARCVEPYHFFQVAISSRKQKFSVVSGLLILIGWLLVLEVRGVAYHGTFFGQNLDALGETVLHRFAERGATPHVLGRDQRLLLFCRHLLNEPLDASGVSFRGRQMKSRAVIVVSQEEILAGVQHCLQAGNVSYRCCVKKRVDLSLHRPVLVPRGVQLVTVEAAEYFEVVELELLDELFRCFDASHGVTYSV